MRPTYIRAGVTLMLGFGVLLAMSQTSRAALVYGLEFSGPTSVAVGSPSFLNVYLKETVSSPDSPVLGDPALGIIQGNFALSRTSGSSIDITAVTGNATFDAPGTFAFTASSAEGNQADNDATVTPTGVAIGGGVYRILLGQVALLANTAGSNTFTLADYSGGDDLFLGDGSVAENTAGFTYGSIIVTASVVAVPEPSSIALLAVIGGIGVYRARRQRSSSAA